MSSPLANAPPTSRTAPSTPIRAITSKLANKAAPSVPPSNQAYEPLVKSLFRHRLRSLLLSSIVSSWAVASAWTWWLQGGVSRLSASGTLTLPITPWVLFSTFLTWLVVALPIPNLRKVFLTARRSGATSPAAIFKEALNQKSTTVTTVVCLMSSLAALGIHIMMAYAHGMDTYGDPKLSLFVKSKKHPRYLNGRLLFLILSQICATLVYVFRGVLIDRYAYNWTSALSHKYTPTYIVVATSGLVSAIFSTFSLVLTCGLFLTLRSGLPLLYKIPFLPLILRPFTAHFLKGSWSLSLLLWNFTLVFRAWFLAFSTLALWEVINTFFNSVIEPVSVATLSADPEVTLVSGLSSSDKIFQYFAFSELRELATENSVSATAQRSKIFGDQKTGLNLWSFLSRESLLVLEGDFQTFLRRGKPAPVVINPAPIKPEPIISPTIATPTPLLRQRVFKVSAASPGQAAMDALASDGPISKAIDVSADATHVPELFRSVENRVVSPIAEETKRTVRTVSTAGGKWKNQVLALATRVEKRYLPSPAKKVWGVVSHWMTRERENKAVEATLPFWEMDVTVIEALSYLTCASLTEDQYGAVQRDIPKILETFISFLQAIEQYQAELSSLHRPPPPDATDQQLEDHKNKLVEIAHAQELLRHVGDGLKDGVLRITATFGDSLRAFKFPPKIAAKLQTFIEYS